MKQLNTMLQNAWEAQKAGDLKHAESIYTDVLRKSPRHAHAWCYLGLLRYDQKRYNEAIVAYENAIRLQPTMTEALNNLGNAFRICGRFEEAFPCFDRAIELRPDYATAYLNRGTANTWYGRINEAIASFERAVELEPENVEAHKNLGVALLLSGDYQRGGVEYEWRRKAERLINEHMFTYPEWDGGDPNGLHILLEAEQGLGDCIQFIRYAELLRQRGARVSARVPKPLIPLLERYEPLEQLVSKDTPPPACDAWVPLLSLPFRLGEFSMNDVPASDEYLSADPELVAMWEKHLAAIPGIKIGIAWQGNRTNIADSMRSFPLDAMAPLDRIAGATLISLQKGPGEEQVHRYGNRLTVLQPDDIVGYHTDEQHGPFMDTAAVMKHLDLVITADSATAHLAGALGVPVWVALPHVPDWRWTMKGNNTPWYPSMRLFRQSKSGDWKPVFKAMAQEAVEQFQPLQWKTPEEHRMLETGVSQLTRAEHGLMLSLRKDIYIGRCIERYGQFSPGEVDMFAQLLRPGRTVIEAGANIGAHTVPLAQIVGPQGAVHAFEPQRVVFQTLCANLALNGIYHVRAHQAALGTIDGSDDKQPTIVAPELNYGSEHNFGGVSVQASGPGQRVPLMTIDSLQLGSCAMIKCDVEGMELDVLRGAEETLKRHRPILYVENDREDSSPALIQFLMDHGYVSYWHFPPLFSPSNYFGNQENLFPGIVSVNLLSVHESVKTSIKGLKQVESPTQSWRDVLQSAQQNRANPAAGGQ